MSIYIFTYGDEKIHPVDDDIYKLMICDLFVAICFLVLSIFLTHFFLFLIFSLIQTYQPFRLCKGMVRITLNMLHSFISLEKYGNMTFFLCNMIYLCTLFFSWQFSHDNTFSQTCCLFIKLYIWRLKLFWIAMFFLCIFSKWSHFLVCLLLVQQIRKIQFYRQSFLVNISNINW